MNVRSVGSKIRGVVSKLDSQRTAISSKVYESQFYWKGDAQKAFSGVQVEVQSLIIKGNSILASISNKLDGLQSSIDQAERDKERKKRERLMMK